MDVEIYHDKVIDSLEGVARSGTTGPLLPRRLSATINNSLSSFFAIGVTNLACGIIRATGQLPFAWVARMVSIFDSFSYCSPDRRWQWALDVGAKVFPFWHCVTMLYRGAHSLSDIESIIEDQKFKRNKGALTPAHLYSAIIILHHSPISTLLSLRT